MGDSPQETCHAMVLDIKNQTTVPPDANTPLF